MRLTALPILFAGALAALLQFSPVTAAATRTLRVATLLPAPAARDGEANSVAAVNDALIREVCQRLAVRCETHPLPFVEIIPGVESGRFQLGVGNVLLTPEREARVLFTQPLWRSSSRLIAAPATIERHGGAALQLVQLHGVSIAAERGTQQHRYLAQLAGARGITLLETRAAGETLGAVLDGRADFALMPMRNAYFLLQQQPAGRLAFAGQAMIENGLGGTTHMILPKGKDALRREVDAALDAMRADGTFQRILRRHLPFLAD